MLSSTSLTVNIRHKSFDVRLSISEEDTATDTTVHRMVAQQIMENPDPFDPLYLTFFELPSDAHVLTIVEEASRILREELT